MRFTDLMAEFFDAAPKNEDGTISIPGSCGSTAKMLDIEEFALFSIVDLLSATAALAEWRTYHNGSRFYGDDWYAFNVEPRTGQNGAEFKRLLFARLFRFNEALVFEQNGGYYIADSFQREQIGFRPPVYHKITWNGEEVRRPLREQDVFYFRLAGSGQAAALRSNINGLYSSAMMEAVEKYSKSGGKSGILHISTLASKSKDFEKNLDKLMNDRFKRFFEQKNAVLPLTEGFSYDPQNTAAAQKSTSEVSDIGSLLTQAQTTACNAFHVPPSILRGEVTNLDDAINSMLSFAVKPAIKVVEIEVNRKSYGKAMLDGWKMQINTTGIKSVDVLAQADKIDKLVQDSIYNPNGIREIVGDEPIPEKWADEYARTKNMAAVVTTAKEEA